MRAARTAGWDAEPEAREDGWVADVLASRGTSRLAFEVQWSAQTRDRFEHGQQRYAADGVHGVWFARYERSVPLPRRDLPVFCTAFAADSVTTVVNGTAMPLADAVIGLLTGRGLVLTAQAAAGDLWLSDGSRVDLAEVVIPSGNLIRLRPRPARAGTAELLHDRQARRFGQLGQESLSRLRVAVVGLGAVGSILVEFLARLGVGGPVLIDDDIVDETNLPRLLAAERRLCRPVEGPSRGPERPSGEPRYRPDGDGGTGRDQHGATVVELL
ncbi:ThiF family adenylyltransferase [Micromonospora sp. NPDC049359]|uniref:ThiF family adenylyltransferase n=1 Tax=Micromonospora sp. NPDC049359 TaxID=3364270 RepID=UPI00379B65DD